MRVVDASVALKWFKDEPGSAEALALLAAEPLVAPELILAEVLNAAWKACRLGAMDEGQTDRVAAELPAFLTRLVPLAALAPSAVRLARRLDHPVYDCFYLALAEHENTAMVTADGRLVRKVAGTNWAGMVAPLDPARGGR